MSSDDEDKPLAARLPRLDAPVSNSSDAALLAELERLKQENAKLTALNRASRSPPYSNVFRFQDIGGKILNTFKNTHEKFPLGAAAELIDNSREAAKPDATGTTELAVKMEHGGRAISFTDNGKGMSYEELYLMLKPARGTKGKNNFGQGFKTGTMGLGSEALVISNDGNVRSMAFLSRTVNKLDTGANEDLCIPFAFWHRDGLPALESNPLPNSGEGDALSTPLKPLKANEKLDRDVLRHIYDSKGSAVGHFEALQEQFEHIKDGGTRILIWMLHRKWNYADGDISLPERDDVTFIREDRHGLNFASGTDVPQDYSLVSYCQLLFQYRDKNPKFKISIQGRSVIYHDPFSQGFVMGTREYAIKLKRLHSFHDTVSVSVKFAYSPHDDRCGRYGCHIYWDDVESGVWKALKLPPRLVQPYVRIGVNDQAGTYDGLLCTLTLTPHCLDVHNGKQTFDQNSCPENWQELESQLNRMYQDFHKVYLDHARKHAYWRKIDSKGVFPGGIVWGKFDGFWHPARFMDRYDVENRDLYRIIRTKKDFQSLSKDHELNVIVWIDSETYGLVAESEIKPWSSGCPDSRPQAKKEVIAKAQAEFDALVGEEEEQYLECSSCGKVRRLRSAEALRDGQYWICSKGYMGTGNKQASGCHAPEIPSERKKFEGDRAKGNSDRVANKQRKRACPASNPASESAASERKSSGAQAVVKRARIPAMSVELPASESAKATTVKPDASPTGELKNKDSSRPTTPRAVGGSVPLPSPRPTSKDLGEVPNVKSKIFGKPEPDSSLPAKPLNAAKESPSVSNTVPAKFASAYSVPKSVALAGPRPPPLPLPRSLSPKPEASHSFSPKPEKSPPPQSAGVATPPPSPPPATRQAGEQQFSSAVQATARMAAGALGAARTSLGRSPISAGGEALITALWATRIIDAVRPGHCFLDLECGRMLPIFLLGMMNPSHPEALRIYVGVETDLERLEASRLLASEVGRPTPIQFVDVDWKLAGENQLQGGLPVGQCSFKLVCHRAPLQWDDNPGDARRVMKAFSQILHGGGHGMFLMANCLSVATRLAEADASGAGGSCWSFGNSWYRFTVDDGVGGRAVLSGNRPAAWLTAEISTNSLCIRGWVEFFGEGGEVISKYTCALTSPHVLNALAAEAGLVVKHETLEDFRRRKMSRLHLGCAAMKLDPNFLASVGPEAQQLLELFWVVTLERPHMMPRPASDPRLHRHPAVQRPADPLPIDPRTADPRLTDPRPADPRLADPRLADPRLADPRLADPRLADPRLADPRPADPRLQLPVADPRLAAPISRPSYVPAPSYVKIETEAGRHEGAEVQHGQAHHQHSPQHRKWEPVGGSRPFSSSSSLSYADRPYDPDHLRPGSSRFEGGGGRSEGGGGRHEGGGGRYESAVGRYESAGGRYEGGGGRYAYEGGSGGGGSSRGSPADPRLRDRDARDKERDRSPPARVAGSLWRKGGDYERGRGYR